MHVHANVFVTELFDVSLLCHRLIFRPPLPWMDTLLNNHGMPGSRHGRLSRLMIDSARLLPRAAGEAAFLELCATLEEAAAAGINCIASSPETEETLGRALAATALQDHLFIVGRTSPALPPGRSAKAAKAELERSLKQSMRRLGCEWLPLVLLDSKSPLEYLPELAECCVSGLAGYCGLALPEPGSPIPPFDHPVMGAVEIPGTVVERGFSVTVRAARDRGSLVFCVPDESRGGKSVSAIVDEIAAELDTTREALLLRAILDRHDIDSVTVHIPNRRKLQACLALTQLPALPREITRRLISLSAGTVPKNHRAPQI